MEGTPNADMSNEIPEENKLVNEDGNEFSIGDYIALNFFELKKSAEVVVAELEEMGTDRNDIIETFNDLIDVFNASVDKHSNSEMIKGALWCIGGTVLTIAEIGFIFWGAIVFGGYQLVTGFLVRSKKKEYVQY